MRVWLIYLRKSIFRTETDAESPERQLHVCQTLLSITDNQPYTLEIYKDLGKSGSSEAGRDDWLRLKQQLNRPEVVGVAAYSLDRIYRNVSEFLAFLTLLEQRGKALKTARENLDTSSPLGRFVVTILMALYEMEWKLTSIRMADMVEDKRRRQGRHWGSAPFGCDRDEDGQLIPSQKTYNLNGETRSFYASLLECFRHYATGLVSYDQTAYTLNVSGWRFWDHQKSEDGQSEYIPVGWNLERVRSVVSRWRLYQGELPLGDARKEHDVEWIPGGHQPILPVDLCNEVGEVLVSRRGKWNKRDNKNRIYMLSGVIYCHCCGQRLSGQFYRRRMYRHLLSKGKCGEVYFDAEQIETEITNAMIELAHHPTLFTDLSNAPYELRAADTQTQEKIRELHLQLTRLEDLYIVEGGISKAAYLARRQTALNELAQLEMQQHQAGTNIKETAETMRNLFDYFEDAEISTKKALVTRVIERLEVKEGHIVKAVPQKWAEPFFNALCEIWAGWELNPDHTNYTIELPRFAIWLNAVSASQGEREK